MLDLQAETVQKIHEALSREPQLLLSIPHVRMIIAHDRLIEAGEARSQVKQDGFVHDHAVTHNMNGLLNHAALWRPDLLYYPLVSIEYIRLRVKHLKMLIVGPRSEAELFTAYACGFRPENVKAIDIISYSSWVELGDVHELPYDDGSFDIVVAGWVLAYSADNQRAADEMLRVLRPGGHLAIGCVAEPRSTLPENVIPEEMAGGVQMTSPDPERPGHDKTVSRYYCMEQIHNLFGDRIDHVIMSEEPHPQMLNERTHLITIFRVT